MNEKLFRNFSGIKTTCARDDLSYIGTVLRNSEWKASPWATRQLSKSKMRMDDESECAVFLSNYCEDKSAISAHSRRFADHKSGNNAKEVKRKL
ncbi:hypothetical protein X798_02779 [Onchocerca flexuosa]|uniref:Uncharacterized protein n=1 Tax=Onchocerca flexuosa TaxID=387005 RepID=A0A238BY95_9BILA|nr:hypothetical protein X798_02779 [Onchocerca flexuosa]